MRGFANHAMMGAALLSGVWTAVYLPSLVPTFKLGGWAAWLAVAAGSAGALGGPLVLVLVEGDEFFGLVGIGAALFFGWAGRHVALLANCPPGIVGPVRLCSAALGPVFLYLGFHLMVKARETRSVSPK